MLVREVFGWLRFCLQQDALCSANQIVVEEIPSPFLNKVDTNDGPRTLAIYCQSKGYTPRIEIRFTADFPQVWWVDKNDKGTYLLSPYSSKFPGDFRMWSRSEFVRYLVDYAKAKLCHDTMTLVTVIPAPAVEGSTQVEAGAKIEFEAVKRIVDAAHRAVMKGTRLTQKMVDDWLKQNTGFNIDQFANDVVYYFSVGKLNWKDIDVLESEYDPQKSRDIVPWDRFDNLLGESRYYKKAIQTPLKDRLSNPKNIESNGAFVETKIKEILALVNEGKDPKAAVTEDPGVFGQKVEAALRSGSIPLPYLSLLEKADLKETIAPWSLVRRSVIAYDIPAVSETPVTDALVEWLDKSHLTAALYQTEDELLKEIIKKKIGAFASATIDNPCWTKELCDEIVGFTDPHERAKALQSEFDMWLLQALSPSVSASKLPMSPYAYNSGRMEEDLYNKVFASWLGSVKRSCEARRELSIKALSHSLEHFYNEVSSGWKSEYLSDYKPRVPSVKEIMSAALKGDKDRLFKVLVADVEDEVGDQMPEEMTAKFKDSPYFNSIFKEIRFQSVKL